MSSSSPSFSDFPDDLQLTILSYLSPSELSAFACTSRRFAALCSASSSSSTPLYLAMCRRRWGSKILLPSSISAVQFTRLYRDLDRWEHLIGFWRRVGRGDSVSDSPLVFFEWGVSSIIGYRVSPSPDSGSYGVLKVPFLWLGFSPLGEPVSFKSVSDSSDLLPANVSFMGNNHFVLEENCSFYADASEGTLDEVSAIESTSPPDRMMSEIYQYVANRTSPGSDKASRRQRKKERERLGRRRGLEAEHFLKVINYLPTPSRPLQGLWKGISEDMVLEFFLVRYDDIGGISCRCISEAGVRFSVCSPVFWTSNITFLEPPFSKEEQDLYSSREHIRQMTSDRCGSEREIVSRVLCINSSYDLVIPDLSGSSGDLRNVEGRIWEYEDGSFGFGFLRNNFIIDLKHMALEGRVLDTVEYFCNHLACE
ncbi:F-box protein At3g12350 [Typha latifolia]|uniref:F-box protein At3g12350 n=1 Tax=Typha latifolia TaxID=4733 RepID=UPI003C2ED59E